MYIVSIDRGQCQRSMLTRDVVIKSFVGFIFTCGLEIYFR